MPAYIGKPEKFGYPGEENSTDTVKLGIGGKLACRKG